MLRIVLFACFLFLACSLIIERDDDYYIAAVVEYTPITNYNPNITKYQAQTVMLQNVKQYGEMVRQAKQKGAQIIVFPEYGKYKPILT